MNDTMRQTFLFLFLLMSVFCLKAQNSDHTPYWNSRLKIVPFRLPPPPIGYKPRLEDLNKDGHPDVIHSITRDSIPILWVDDDQDLTRNDLEGDTDNDCLLIDRNRDGIYGGQGDLIIDWVDSDNDGKADMQLVVEYPKEKTAAVWPNGHYMVVLDMDKDNIFNYIDWNTFQLKCWEKTGLDDFYTDYSGHTAFLKIHASTYNLQDTRLNWENPFLFYDEDGDGLSEIAIRLVDSPGGRFNKTQNNTYEGMQLTGSIDWVSFAVDLDNDNAPDKHFDFDWTLAFSGEGFNYRNQIHTIKNLRGLPEADQFFMDPRWRQMTELIYPDHATAKDLIFRKGNWDRVTFVYDEDDDCHRWERVELYDPLNPFIIGARKGGIDNNTQSDAAGDRGEWDLDNSGKGKLYISKFDGRLHLFGAEWGCWRIDQNADTYQGWDRLWVKREPTTFATVKYTDQDKNGFIDQIEYDLDGDTLFEQTVDFKKLKINDVCETIDVSNFTYADFQELNKKMAENMWSNALASLEVAKKYKLNNTWYAKLLETASLREKYHNGYWLQFYLFKDLEDLFLRSKLHDQLNKLYQAYYTRQWFLL